VGIDLGTLTNKDEKLAYFKLILGNRHRIQNRAASMAGWASQVLFKGKGEILGLACFSWLHFALYFCISKVLYFSNLQG
jgi:hypothetical protein